LFEGEDRRIQYDHGRLSYDRPSPNLPDCSRGHVIHLEYGILSLSEEDRRVEGLSFEIETVQATKNNEVMEVEHFRTVSLDEKQLQALWEDNEELEDERTIQIQAQNIRNLDLQFESKLLIGDGEVMGSKLLCLIYEKKGGDC
jgi:hypothetical protein